MAPGRASDQNLIRPPENLTLQQLRSTASGTPLVQRTRTATSQRSFDVNGPRTWNSLPADVRTPDTTLFSFKRHLEAHLFQQS